MRLRNVLGFLLLMLLAILLAPLLAQWTTSPERLLKQGRFTDLEHDYRRALAARSRTPWGEFQSEEFLRRLHLSLTWKTRNVADTPAADLDARTLAWLRSSPGSSIAVIARVNSLLPRARDAYARRDWDAGDALTKEARSLLSQVREEGRSDPNWHTAWLYIARLEGWSTQEVMAAVEEASEVEPAAMGPWISAVAALSPDGRDPSVLGPLAELALRKTKATEGWSMHARIYLAAARTYRWVHRDPFGRGGIDWPTLNMAMTDLQARFPDDANLNQHAVLACLAHDKAVTAALLGRIAAKPDRFWWSYWAGERFYDRCRQWATDGAI